MKFTHLNIQGLILIEPDIYQDSRGFFFESYNQNQFEEHGIKFPFVQDNLSQSNINVIRGLHFQEAPFEQGKLVTVAKGRVWDVVVDLRMDSATFGKHVTVELDAKSKK